MFYDLSIPWADNMVELQRTLSFLADRMYLDRHALVMGG
jgi:hypothetical protein